jgi:predicted deacylase
MIDGDEAFTFQGGSVEPGETQNFRYTVSETYLSDPVWIPVTIINGERSGPVVFLSAAAHGDELNGSRSSARQRIRGITPISGEPSSACPF